MLLNLLASTPTPSIAPAVGSGGPDIATILITGLVTLLVGAAGTLLGISLERRKAESQALVAKRIEVYDEIAPRINAILCFYACIGDWKRISPEEVLAHKRAVDRSVKINGALLSPETLAAHRSFMTEFFETWIARGEDARLRADIAYLQNEWGRRWRSSWTRRFSTQQPDGREARAALATRQRAAYDAFLGALARDIGVKG